MAEMLANGLISTNEKENKSARSVFYKKPIKKDNYRLEVDNEDTPQEVRRQRLLQFQKKCREISFNAGRGIVEEAFNSEDEYDDDVEFYEPEKKKYFPHRRNKHYANQLMMSEWMFEVPQDFVEKWIIVPCPQGKRTLVVACKGITKAYNRRGNRLGKFYSALPGGSPSEHRGSCTILDCIWISSKKTYFVLDVLAWSNQSLLNCDTEFRFFWLRSQMQDIKELQERGTYRNTYPIILLPNIHCDENINVMLSDLILLPPLDGLLFYHRDGQYTKGRTPLVTWLKPFMLSEILGISIPPPLDEKPDGYVDIRHYIRSSITKKKNTSDDSMQIECDDVCDGQ
ncbi:hypothetical protein KM043_004430 [Ampulex compressa]|nr:hypothetical protein KM043_004430 [Ampulex compressa]